MRAASLPAALPRALLLLLLAGCGGGFFVNIGDRIDNTDPSVDLVSAVDTTTAGQAVVRFVAAASDENGIDRVTFFRVDPSGNADVGSDTTAPYTADVTIPDDGRTTLQVFARARDEAGNTADSATVTVTVTR